MHPRRVERDGVQQLGAGLDGVALRVAGGQEPLVAPPEVQPRPVDRVARRGGGDRGQQGVAVASAGEHHRGGAAGGLGVHDPGDQPGRGRLGHQLLVPVDDQLRGGRGHAPAFLAPRLAAPLRAPASGAVAAAVSSATASSTAAAALAAAAATSAVSRSLSRSTGVRTATA